MTTSDKEWQQMKTSGTTNDNEWYNEWQQVTMNDNEWQQMTMNKNDTIYFKEWMIVIPSITRIDTLL